MRNIVIFLSIVAIGVIAWLILSKKHADNGPSLKPLAVSKHSSGFNESVEGAMNEYYSLTECFVNWDSSQVNHHAQLLSDRLSNLKLDELKKDTTGILETAQSFVDNARSDAQKLQQDTSITDKRHSFNSLTDNLYQFLRVIKYDVSKLYLQQCPMAFGDDNPGIWLSKTDSIRNPYLGLHHPKYGRAMIDCGETKDTLNFTRLK
jgi:Protein of unknown function (DUF3347)